MKKKQYLPIALSIIGLLIVFVFSLFYKKNDRITKREAALSILESSQGVNIAAHALPSQEISEGMALMANQQGYTVIALTIENHSAEQFELKKESIDLKLTDRKTVMKKVKHSALIRSVLFKVAGLFFWPASIPGAIDGVISMNSIHSLKNRLHAAMLKKEGEIILPFSAIHRYLFIPGDEVPQIFKVKLFNCHNLKTETHNVEIT